MNRPRAADQWLTTPALVDKYKWGIINLIKLGGASAGFLLLTRFVSELYILKLHMKVHLFAIKSEVQLFGNSNMG